MKLSAIILCISVYAVTCTIDVANKIKYASEFNKQEIMHMNTCNYAAKILHQYPVTQSILKEYHELYKQECLLYDYYIWMCFTNEWLCAGVSAFLVMFVIMHWAYHCVHLCGFKAIHTTLPVYR